MARIVPVFTNWCKREGLPRKGYVKAYAGRRSSLVHAKQVCCANTLQGMASPMRQARCAGLFCVKGLRSHTPMVIRSPETANPSRP